jgi:hypothetical protein
MKISEIYSHLNGHEHILVHKPEIWNEIEEVVNLVDAGQWKVKVSKEKTKLGKDLYDPRSLNTAFKQELEKREWHESRTSYWVTRDFRLIRKTFNLPPNEQRQEIIDAGQVPIYSYNQTDFVKERIAIEVQLGKYFAVSYDLFVKHMAFYVGDVIDVGVEILPMKEMQAEMSSGVSYFEGELYNVIRQGRGVPAVPLVLIGIVP